MRTRRAAMAAAVLITALTATACQSGPQSYSKPMPLDRTEGNPTVPTVPAVPAAPSTTPAPSVRAVAAPDACAKNTKKKAVIVRLSKQHMWLCEKSKTVRDSAITSGMTGQYTETPTGRFEIQSRTRDTSLTLKSGKSYAVKYWIPFDAPLFGFHDSSWQDFAYGSAKYKTEGSHGCVHLPVKTIRFLYQWADIGTSVRIKQ